MKEDVLDEAYGEHRTEVFGLGHFDRGSEDKTSRNYFKTTAELCLDCPAV